jgi:predicted amidohydrolase
MSHFAIAGLQLELTPGNNLPRIRAELERLKIRFPWVQMALLGELSVFGADVMRAEPMPGKTEEAFCAIARDLGLWLVPGSMYERAGDKVYNTTPVIDTQGTVVARYRKMFPFLPYEKGVEAGGEYVTFEVPGVGCFGVSICYDMWFPETIRRLACMGAEVILHPTMTNTLDRELELAFVRTHAALNQVYFFDINSAGTLAFGRSTVAGPDGNVIHVAGTGHEIIPVEIDLAHLRRARERGVLGCAQPLKSFRDSRVDLLPGPRERLGALGPLAMPAPP